MLKYHALLITLFLFSLPSRGQTFIKDYSCTPVETDARFVDSTNGWDNYLTATINTAVPVVNCAPQGSYKIEIRFLIDKDGTVKDIKALTVHGFGMEAEVIRVIRQSPKWIPATRNGRVVRCYKRQSFIFAVSSQL